MGHITLENVVRGLRRTVTHRKAVWEVCGGACNIAKRVQRYAVDRVMSGKRVWEVCGGTCVKALPEVCDGP